MNKRRKNKRKNRLNDNYYFNDNIPGLVIHREMEYIRNPNKLRWAKLKEAEALYRTFEKKETL